jgi:hypothetical protein
MRTSVKVNKSEVEWLVKQVLSNSFYLDRKQCYYTAYFWIKNEEYPQIFSQDLNDFVNKVRETSIKYINSKNILN